MTTTTGSSAATAPLTLIRAVRPATSSIIRTISRVRLSPTRSMSSWPAHVVTPVASSALADDEQRRDEDDRRVAEARQRLVRSRTPVKYSARRPRSATSPTGIRFETNAMTTRQDREA